ncbi:MAG: DUF2911 domain-containing protein [Candidatus Kapabacteria bacterium]|nr:DUF2911 domain-containing protein [Candidatus Kapabacteria bacterium]
MKILFVLLATALVSLPLSAQDLKLPALSPTSTISQEFSTSKMEIVYSRPSMRGRTVFGDLVPYGIVWRTGANAATKVTFGEDVMIGDSTVKAGSYSFYSVPGMSEWEIILNKNTGNWGAMGYETKDDVVRLKVKPTTLPEAVETFTISIGNISFSSCTIDLAWERVHVSVPVKANNQERLKTNIEKAINNPTIPYQQAATYYFETNQNLDVALDYASKAAEKNPKGYWLFMMKARIAAKLGKNDVAREAANKTIEVAKGTPSEAEYTKYAQDLISTLK